MPKHAKVKVYEKYNSEGKLQGEKCPRCGGLLAKHSNRVTCGKCGYSEIRKRLEQPAVQKTIEKSPEEQKEAETIEEESEEETE